MKVTLKKPWRSPRGKLYPAGTVFITNKQISSDPWLKSTWYDFCIPEGAYGFVLFPDSLFKVPTPEELAMREQRRKLIEEHMAATADPFLHYLK